MGAIRTENPLPPPKCNGRHVLGWEWCNKVAIFQVRIKVIAAALNFSDALQLQGLYQEKPKLPFIPGSEVSGKVVEAGNDVRTLKVGDTVRFSCIPIACEATPIIITPGLSNDAEPCWGR